MFQKIKDAITVIIVLVLAWYAWRLTHWVSRLESRIADDVRIVSDKIGAGVHALEDRVAADAKALEARVENRVHKIESRFEVVEKWFEGFFKRGKQ